MPNLPTRTPDAKTAAAAHAIATELPDGELKIAGVKLPLPEPIAQLLRQALASYGSGKPVSLITGDGEMTPNEAAEYLNVSRGYVTKLMDEGTLPFRQVGTHRRIPTAAVIAYDLRQRAQSDAALNDLTALSQEMGLYDIDPRMPERGHAK
jgi:excisionase family DNA binding protein